MVKFGFMIVIFIFVVFNVNIISAITVDADYITIYPGEDGKITLNIDNTEDFDIEEISVSIDLDKLDFTPVGRSEKEIDDLDEGDDDSVSFTLKASTDIQPGDYDIPYLIEYLNADSSEEEKHEKKGTFGIRVSAKTDIDFSIETRGKDTISPIVGKEGRITLEVINKGLAEIKAVNIKIIPEGYELLSKESVFIGTINADDTDLASFDVIYRSTSPKLKAEVTYKDFENKDQTASVDMLFKVYSEEQAIKLGLMKKSNSLVYFIILIVLLIAWYIWRRLRKGKKKNGR